MRTYWAVCLARIVVSFVSLYCSGGEDYETTTMTLTFTPDNQDMPQCINVPIFNDNDTEGSEQFLGELATNEPRLILAPNLTTITILDDDGKCWVCMCVHMCVYIYVHACMYVYMWGKYFTPLYSSLLFRINSLIIRNALQ